MVLLHILRGYSQKVPVYFLNTGYHFSETIAYKDAMAQWLGIEVHDIYPATPKSMQKDVQGKLLFTSDPDFCCYLNKTQPMEAILQSHDVWINGIRKDQNPFRQGLQEEEAAPYNSLRFHPMLNWPAKKVYDYVKAHDIPRNPLDAAGYTSIGCEPCTRRRHPDIDEREARWYGLNKAECGLHTDLIKKT